jgi:transposase
MWDIKPQTLYYWYRNYLSDYPTDILEGQWPAASLVQADESTGEIHKEQPIYVFKPENLGSEMSIDDKQIARDGFTVMSNTRTGKMAMLIESRQCEEIKQALLLFGKELSKIHQVSCDMSPTYISACQSTIPYVQLSIDKFHVMQYVYDALSQVRNRIKTDLSLQLSKGKHKTDNDRALLFEIECLKRCKFLLWQSQEKWNEESKSLMNYLFEKYHLLRNAYALAQQLKQWYDKSHIQKPRKEIQQGLTDWYKQVEESMVKEFKPVMKMIEKHEENIINFFISGLTNAKAERLNGKIQRFVSCNYGFKDKNFALYRMAKYFS